MRCPTRPWLPLSLRPLHLPMRPVHPLPRAVRAMRILPPDPIRSMRPPTSSVHPVSRPPVLSPVWVHLVLHELPPSQRTYPAPPTTTPAAPPPRSVSVQSAPCARARGRFNRLL